MRVNAWRPELGSRPIRATMGGLPAAMKTRFAPYVLGALAVLVLVLLAACTEEPAAPEGGTPAAPPQPAALVIETPEVHDAICGCALDHVKRCGNYVKLEDQYVVLEWPELGKMEYCAEGKAGAKVEIAGAMKDGKFVATSYERVE